MNDNLNKWGNVDSNSSSDSLDRMHYNRQKNKRGVAEELPLGVTKSELFMARTKDASNSLTTNALSQVSEERKDYLRSVLDKEVHHPRANMIKSASPVLVKESSLLKTAMANPVGRGGSSSTTQIAPDYYSPLWLSQNLQLPRDLITANAWNRAFYETNPVVRNAINLHATYPISKMNIKCDDPKVEQFFHDMIEKVDLQEVVQRTALEFWKHGECFIYASFDEQSGSWDKIYHHNPDFVKVQASPIPGVSSISLRPDPDLKRIVTSSKAEDRRIRDSLDPRIIHHVLMGEYIPLDSFNISHLKNLSAPYDVRGTSIIVSVWKDLVLYDKLRECHDKDTEVLTSEGFKHYSDIMSICPDTNEVILDSGVKIACFNPDTEGLEYHSPIKTILKKYKGDMVHFKGENIDVKVTPNHRMNVSTAGDKGWGEWHEELAGEMSDHGRYRFRSQVKWEGKDIEEVDIGGVIFPIELYLEFTGYVLNDGCSQGKKNFASHKRMPRWILDLSPRLLEILLDALVLDNGSLIPATKGDTLRKEYSTSSKELADGVYEAAYKCGYVPRLTHRTKPANYLEKPLTMYTVFWSDATCGNFPSFGNSSMGAGFEKVEYDDFVWCFEVPTDMFVTRRNGRVTVQHNSKYAQADSMINPLTLVKVGSSNPDGHYPGDEELELYREILEQAQYDKDFKMVTHDAVSIERVGYNGSVMDTAADFTMIVDNILMGLMVPKAIMTQEGATYASASVALDVMRQRYNNFRTLMSNWLEKKIFAPISEVQKFYKYENGIKRLIVPKVEWNHMTLYDLDNYLGHITPLVEKKQVSLSTVYRSLGLDRDDEHSKIRAEAIQAMIVRKEEEELGKKTLVELRSLDPKKPIPETMKDSIPGGPSGGMDDLLGPLPGVPETPMGAPLGPPGGMGDPTNF